MTLTEKINNDIKEAMKIRNQIRLDTLRMLNKNIDLDARGNLPDEEVVKLFKIYFRNLQDIYLKR